MKPKIINVDGIDYSVTVAKIQSNPLAFAIKAAHPTSGATHEHSITMGSVDTTEVPSLDLVQSALDAAREHAAKKCHQNHKLNEISNQLV